jgi:D-alanine-D-alanine ligase
MSAAHRFAGRKVAVLLGGISAEREVSLDTGRGVTAALAGNGWNVEAVDWQPGSSLPELLARAAPAVVWNALHGTPGEDGSVQGLCACLGLPCTGSGVLASALAMDKVMSKRIFESNAIPTPAWQVLKTELVREPKLPCVVKPANEGSSVGVSIVESLDQLPAAIELARKYHGPIIIEDYIAGTEVFVGILNGRVLGAVEVRPATKFYDYEAKYKRRDTRYLLPPELPTEVVVRCEQLALAAYDALGCSGHARPDLRIATSGDPFVLEVNTLPGMTATSLLPKIAARAGMSYATLCEEILATAL